MVDRLAEAAAAGDVDTVEQLLRGGVPVDGHDSGPRPRTALDHAVFARQTDSVRVLLAAGADPGQRIGDYHESLPLWHVAVRGMTDMARLLLEAGAPPDGRPPRRETPLARAAAQNHPETVVLLLEHGATTGSVPGRSRTALDIAACEGLAQIVRLLLAHDAGPYDRAVALARSRAADHRSDPVRRSAYEETIAALDAAHARFRSRPLRTEADVTPPSRPTSSTGTLSFHAPPGRSTTYHPNTTTGDAAGQD